MLILSDTAMLEHDPGAMHPESPERLAAVQAALEPVAGLTWHAPRRAEREHLLRVHSAAHIDRIAALAGRAAAIDPDTRLSKGSVEAAFLAAGAAVDAVEAVMKGPDRQAFALVRPPGHHAEPHLAMGFCLFNNVAVAAAHAREALGCQRVLIVDWDVHHGNGTQAAFLDRRDVLFFSLHQFPFYPGTGAVGEIGQGAGEGYTVNVPWSPGRGDADYAAALSDVLVPIADAFAPDLVLVSAGFDAHRDDPLASMEVSEEGFARMAATVGGIAERHAQGRLVLLLEGGYDLGALGRSARASVEALLGSTPPAVGPVSDGAAATLTAVRRQHGGRLAQL